MKLIKRDEKRSMQPINLPDAMNRLFEQSIWDPFSTFFESRFPVWDKQIFIPDIDISEDEKNLKIEVSLPGYDPKNVEVQLDADLLTIKGKAEEEKEEKGQRFYLRERSYGEFYREVSLPTSVDVDKATCKNKNGLLSIIIPKVELRDRKKIPIETEK